MFVAVFSGYCTPVSCSKILTGISVEGISVGVQQWGPHPLHEERRFLRQAQRGKALLILLLMLLLWPRQNLSSMVSFLFSSLLIWKVSSMLQQHTVFPLGFPEPSPRAWPEGVILLPPSSTQQPRLGQGTRGAGALLVLLEGTMRDFSLSRALGSPTGSFLHFIFPLFP